jgi:glycosyltransferase involved in cell wall biosynthesis
MNLAFAVHYYDRTEGTGGYVVELVSRLAARHDVTVYAVAARTPVPEGVRFVRVPALTGRAYATILTFPPALAAVRGRHDLLHAQGWVTRRADVVTAHIVLGAWREAARRADIIPPPGERLFGRVLQGREAALLRRARAVIAPSDRARADILRVAGRASGVSVIPHGFDRDLPLPGREEARARLGLPADAFVALYAGDVRKGLAPLLPALLLCPGAHLLILSHSARERWLRLAGAAGVEDRVHWAPPGTQAAQAFGAADVLAHPTIYDTFGLVVAEALWIGVPAIVSREAGVAELVEHRRSAWVLESPSVDATADALRTLAADRALRSTLATGGRAVAAQWTWDRTAAAVEALYEGLRR